MMTRAINKKLSCLILSIYVLTFILSFIPLPVYGAIVDGNSVYQGDKEYFVRATPHTLSASGWVEVVYNVNYDGAVDVVCGFANDGTVLKEAQVYEEYEHGNKTKYPDWNKSIIKSDETFLDYQGTTRWQTSKINKIVTKNTFNTIRVWIDIPFNGTDEISGKYNIAIKPSSLTVQQAKDQGKLWILDPWYSSSWGYRKTITVTNASADYQTKILIGKTNAASGEDVDLGGNCLDTFADLRFTGADAVTLLDYWIESVVDSGGTKLATVWVQNNATPDTTLYMYYGNAGAAAVSNGANTFPFFDGFDGDLSKWGGNTEAAGIASGILTLTGNNSWRRIYGDTTTPASTFAVRTSAYFTGSRYQSLGTSSSTSYETGHLSDIFTDDGSGTKLHSKDGTTVSTANSNITVDAYKTFDIIVNANTNMRVYENGSERTGSPKTTNPSNSTQFPIMWVYTTGTCIKVDWYLLRKYTATEPSFAFGGATGYPTCALTGTVTAAIEDNDIVAGGKTIILTLTNDTWVATGAVFDAQRQNIIDGLDSAQVEATGWNAEVRDKIPVTDVVRTNDTIVTITLTAEAGYSITAQETITATIPSTAMTIAAAGNLTATPTFTIDVSFVAPSVTTNMWTGYGADYGIVNGTITAIGDAGVTQRGFDYGLTTAYGSSSITAGTYGVGNYMMVLTGLQPATVYHYRAKAFNTAWGYGSDMTFSTEGSPIIYESNTSTSVNCTAIYGSNQSGQTFTVNSTAHSITSVDLQLYKTGTPGDITVSIYHASSSNVTTGDALITGTIDDALINTSNTTWVKCTFSTALNVQYGLMYAIVVKAPNGSVGNSVCWERTNADSYTGGNGCTTVNGGITWTAQTYDFLFRIWGDSSMEIQDVKIFEGFKTTGDWLIVIRYLNTYPPYYDTYDIKQLFDIQLLDIGGTLRAGTACPEWGNKVGCIYLSPTTVSSLSWGSAYTVQLYGKFTGHPTVTYVLESTDWIGVDLNLLDAWAITSAGVIGDYYGEVLTANISTRGEVLNPDGASVLNVGIPGLMIVRPNIFQVSKTTPSSSTPTFTQANRKSNWQTIVGPDTANMLTDIGSIISVDGRTIGVFICIILMIILAAFGLGPAHSMASNVITIPILFMAAGLLFLDQALIAIIFLVLSVLALWQFVLNKGG